MLKTKPYYIPSILIAIFLILMVNYFDRSAIAYAITPIQETFHLNNAQFGLIASAFGMGYLLMTLGGGILVDYYQARRVLTISNILWSIISILIGLATGFWMLFILRILLGLTEGPSFPSLTQVIARWLPLSKRVRMMSLALASVPFASVLGAPFIAHLIITFNWRIAFVILGILGLILAIVWYLIYRDYSDNSATEVASKENVSTLKTSWRFLLFNPTLLANNYAYFTYGYLFFFALTWLPGYLQQTYGLHLRQVGWFLILPWLTGTLFLLFGGGLSDKLLVITQKLRVARSHIIWLSQLFSAICFMIIIRSHSLNMALIFISLGLGFSLLPNAVFYSVNIDLAEDHAATSLGIMDCFFALGGILAPFITGLVSHLTGKFDGAIFLLVGLTLTSVVGIILFHHPDEQHVSRY